MVGVTPPWRHRPAGLTCGGSDVHDGGMTSTLDSTSSTSPPPQRRRERNAGHIVAIVVGCLLLLPAFGTVVGGGALAIGQAVATDDDGYFRFTLDRVESDGVAVGTTDLWFDDIDGDTPWVFDWLDVDLRLRVDGAGPTDDVFVGIARAADVERYLDDAAWSEVIELDDRFPIYRQFDGIGSIDAPLDQDFWTETAIGPGEQEITWDARGGRWAVVVMNADGSPVVEADIEVGARSGAVAPVAITLLVGGGIVLAGAITLIVVGARGRRTPEAPMQANGSTDVDPVGDSSTGAPLPPPTSDTVAQPDDHDRTPEPVA